MRMQAGLRERVSAKQSVLLLICGACKIAGMVVCSKNVDASMVVTHRTAISQVPPGPVEPLVLILPGPSLEIIGPVDEVSVPDEVSPGALPAELPELE